MELLSGNRIKMVIAILVMILVSMFSISAAASSTLTELENESENLKDQLADINDDIVEISTELDELNKQIEITEGAIEQTQAELADSLIEEEEQYESMKNRIRYMYETGNATFLEMLFGAESMADFINVSDFISTITEYDRDMLLELTEIRESIEFDEANLVGEMEAVEALKSEAEEKESTLRAKASETQTDLDAALSEIAVVKAQIAAEEEARLEQERLEQENNANNDSNDAGDDGNSNDSNNSQDSDGDTEEEDPYTPSNSELDIFAALLDCEAGASYEYRLAVATVIMNRVSSSKFPGSITGVIYQKGQFSPTWTGSLDRKLAAGPSSLSYQVAQDAMNGSRLASVSHCYYFLYAPSTSRDGINIGNNLFFASW